MKYAVVIFVSLVISSCQGQTENAIGISGNPVSRYIQDLDDPSVFVDPIDDTINYKIVKSNFYTDRQNRVYIRTAGTRITDTGTTILTEYFKDVTGFIDLSTYKELGNGFFICKEKVYIWWSNSDGVLAIEVKDADAKTFSPFDDVAGGVDNQHAFYGGPPGGFQIIEGADPKSIKVLNPKRGCWNCGDSYFIDDKNVLFGTSKIESADRKTFQLVNQENVDAEDRYHKYYDGNVVK